MALSRPRLRAQYVGQEGFRCAVTVQNVVLAAFLEIDHELHGDPRIAGPARVRRVAAIAAEISRIASVRHHASSMRTRCAPFHSTVLPISSRLSRLEVSVMKWLPASCPILLAKCTPL